MTRKRRNFSKATLVEGFARCGGRCEGMLESGARCNAVLVPGRWHGDHIRPDGLDGEPTLANLACLCVPCHDLKTRTKDVPAIAQAKRREAAAIGASRPKGTIPQRPRPPKREPRPSLPPRRLYERKTR